MGRRNLFLVWLVCWSACLGLSGWMRHALDAEQYPWTQKLGPVTGPSLATFNPGRASLRTWWKWDSLSPGDFEPIFFAAQKQNAVLAGELGGLADAGGEADSQVGSEDDLRMYAPEGLRDSPVSFVYTPFTALLLAPFVGADSTLEPFADRVSWVNHLLVLLCLWLLFDLAFGRNSSDAPQESPRRLHFDLWDVLLFGLQAVLCFPLVSALELTQAGVWIFTGLCLSAWCLNRQRTFAAGLALALGTSIKPHLVVVLPMLALVPGFPRRMLVGAFVGLLSFGLASIAYAGWDNCWLYVSGMLPELSTGYPYFRNQSFHGLFLRWFSPQDGASFYLAEAAPGLKRWAAVASALLLIAVWLPVFLKARSLRSESLREPESGLQLEPVWVFVLLLNAVALASPVCWMHHYVSLGLLASLLVRYSRSSELHSAGLSASLTFVGVLGWALCSSLLDARAFSNGRLAWLSGLELLGGLLLLLVAVLAMRSKSERFACLLTRSENVVS